MSTSPQHAARGKAPAVSSRTQSPVLQRTCACGGHAGGAGECENCRKKKESGTLQRRGTSQASPSQASTEAPAIVHDVLRSPGRPLDRDTRGFMESRFGHDFSGVRVHTDPQAADSARAVQAEAYTVGRQIVFGNSSYAPTTRAGRRLLAHELTHVVQQSGQPSGAGGGLRVGSPTDSAEHEAELVSDIVTGTPAVGVPRPPILVDTSVTVPHLRRRNIFDAIAGLFKGDSFGQAELQAYLKHLDTTGSIEGFNESDNKARAVVNAWRLGGSPYVLTAQRKILLIKEMQSGFTGDDDELAILEILERSYNGELGMIFGSVGVADLNSDFHGEEWDLLQGFYARRFEGGMPEMLKGRIAPKGLPVALGTDLTKANDVIDFQLPGAVTDWNIPCVLGILCSQDKAVVAKLPLITVKVADAIFYDNPFYDGSSWTTKRFDAAGIFNRVQRLLMVLRKDDCPTVAFTFFHEVRHLNQAAGLDVVSAETDAYLTTEQWSIDRGLPGRPSLRMEDPVTKKTVPDPAKIDTLVRDHYAGVAAVPGERVIGKTAAGHTQIRRPNGTTYTRPPQAGDTFQAPRQVSNVTTISPAAWVCPAP